jgi:hypothetical protein
MTLRALTVSGPTDFAAILQQIDDKLFIHGTGNPSGAVAASRVGQLFYDQTANVFYKCTATDGTIANTTWAILVNTAAASETASGAIEIATQAEVDTGTDDVRAVTPLKLKTAYLSKAGNLSGIGSPTAARTALDITAPNIPISAIAGIVATTVQAALAEINAGKATLAGNSAQTFSVADATLNTHAASYGQTEARYVKKAGDSLTGFLSLHADPSSAMHPATKQYVDATRTGLQIKEAVRVRATSNVNIGTGGLLVVNGVTVASGDRVLLSAQTVPAENGIYVASAGAWVRAVDVNETAEVKSGMFFFVSEGTVDADSGWVLTTNDPIVLGTTPLTFAKFSQSGEIQGGAGMTKTGDTLNVISADSNRIVVNADNIDVGPYVVLLDAVQTLTNKLINAVSVREKVVNLGTIASGATVTCDLSAGGYFVFTAPASTANFTIALSNIPAADIAQTIVIEMIGGRRSGAGVITYPGTAAWIGTGVKPADTSLETGSGKNFFTVTVRSGSGGRQEWMHQGKGG